jgi:ribosomal subunit interface protein
MTNLPIHLTAHHLHLSSALREFVRRKLTPVKRFANDALAADVVLRRHNGAKRRFSASARLALPGCDIHGRAVHVDLYVAIGRLVTRLARRSRKRKTRLGRTLERRHHPLAAPALTAQSPVSATTASAASTREPRNKEGGQEMRAFPFRRRDALMPAGEVTVVRLFRRSRRQGHEKFLRAKPSFERDEGEPQSAEPQRHQRG